MHAPTDTATDSQTDLDVAMDARLHSSKNPRDDDESGR